MIERRVSDQIAEGAYILAIIYTLGFLATIGSLMFMEIPSNNRELLISLVGIMSAAQLGIIKHYYDGSKAADAAQAANIARSSRTEAVVQEIAKAAAPTAAAAVAAATGATVVTPAPVNPETGIIPAAEVQQQPKEPTP